jgi:chromosome segregation ATPase
MNTNFDDFDDFDDLMNSYSHCEYNFHHWLESATLEFNSRSTSVTSRLSSDEKFPQLSPEQSRHNRQFRRQKLDIKKGRAKQDPSTSSLSSLNTEDQKKTGQREQNALTFFSGKQSLSQEEKKQRRKIRNRITAARSREKTNKKLTSLQEENANLKNRVQILEQQIQELEEKNTYLLMLNEENNVDTSFLA